MDAAKGAGAETIVTACPLCQANLDSSQGKDSLPVFYFTELMRLAMCLPGPRKWLKKHLVEPSGLLKSHGLM